MNEKDLDTAIEKCERIMEFDTRTLENPESENGWIFDKVYDLLQFLRQFQFATDTNVGGTDDTIGRQAAIETVRKAKDKSEAHRMLIQLPSAQPGWIPTSERLPKDFEEVLVWYEYFRYGEYNRMYQTYGVGYYNSEFDIWGGDINGRKVRVFAWMPLPAPWEGGQS